MIPMVGMVLRACTCVVALAVAPAPKAAAGEPPPVQRPQEVEKPAPEPADPHLERLKSSMRNGDLAVEQGHLETAVKLWEEALRATAPVESTRLYRTALVHRFVSIQIRLFRKSGDIQHLVDAHALVRTRLWEYDRYHTRDFASAQEREELVERRNEIAALKQRAEGSDEYGEFYDQHKANVLRDDPALRRRYRRGLGVAIAGVPMLVVGTALTAALYGLGEFPYAFLAVNTIMAVAGGIMLPVGIVVRVRARKELHHRTNARIEALFASDPPPAPPPSTADNSPLSLHRSTFTLRF